MKQYFRLMYSDMQDGLDCEANYETDTLTIELPDGKKEFSLSYARHVFNKPYHITMPQGGWKTEFTTEEKARLRPMAETLAMLDGNAFFTCDGGDGTEWYEQYLPEAHAVYESNGGDTGWAGEASFAKEK